MLWNLSSPPPAINHKRKRMSGKREGKSSQNKNQHFSIKRADWRITGVAKHLALVPGASYHSRSSGGYRASCPSCQLPSFLLCSLKNVTQEPELCAFGYKQRGPGRMCCIFSSAHPHHVSRNHAHLWTAKPWTWLPFYFLRSIGPKVK